MRNQFSELFQTDGFSKKYSYPKFEKHGKLKKCADYLTSEVVKMVENSAIVQIGIPQRFPKFFVLSVGLGLDTTRERLSLTKVIS